MSLIVDRAEFDELYRRMTDVLAKAQIDIVDAQEMFSLALMSVLVEKHQGNISRAADEARNLGFKLSTRLRKGAIRFVGPSQVVEPEKPRIIVP